MTIERNRISTCIPIAATIAAALLLFIGCGKGNPATPGLPEQGSQATDLAADSQNDNRYSWGLWDITIDPVSLTGQIVPAREAEWHYNVLHMLEGWSCQNCVTLANITWKDKHTMLIDITIRHPYPPNRLDLTGRDVRGIAIFDGTTSFPAHTVRNAKGIETPLLASRRILNADGYTTHFNRWTANEGNGIFDYQRGRFAPPSEVGHGAAAASVP